MDDDIPLSKAQIIWDYQGSRPDRAAVRVASLLTPAKDDEDYFSSWGACNMDFNEADDAGKLAMLFQQFHSMVLADKVDPAAIHEAFLVIPEYRAAIHPELVPEPYRAREYADY